MKDLKPLWSFQGPRHRLALAFGWGVALGIIPGTGALAAACCAAIFRLNLPLMIAGALLTNPVTSLFLYPGSFFLGRWLLGDWLPAGLLAQIALGTITGNLVLAVGLGLIGYLAVWGLITWVRARHAPGH